MGTIAPSSCRTGRKIPTGQPVFIQDIGMPEFFSPLIGVKEKCGNPSIIVLWKNVKIRTNKYPRYPEKYLI